MKCFQVVQFTGENYDECVAACPAAFTGQRGRLALETPEGEMVVLPGDWIMRGADGEFYPCRQDKEHQ